jgi:NADPH:quinone reductase-like Zn-dependent oxidoreductase
VTYPAVRRVEQAAAWPLAGLCAWEAIALATGRMPTITQACRAHRAWLVPVAAAVLALHIWFAPPPTSPCPDRAPGLA